MRITKKAKLPLVFAFLLLASALPQVAPTNVASASSTPIFPTLAMPVEYVNYTITRINGTLWAQVNGDFPIYLMNQPSSSLSGLGLSILYPMPPDTTNIHVYLNNREVSWSNYTQEYPQEVHETALGNWWMISSFLGNLSSFLQINVAYEHPLQVINGSYLFLYNLNISQYLTPLSTNSTCYYTINIEANATNIRAYTTGNGTEWNPINFTNTKTSTGQAVSIVENSVYQQPLPGDLLVEFQVPTPKTQSLTVAVVAVVVVAVAVSVVGLLFCINKRNAKSQPSNPNGDTNSHRIRAFMACHFAFTRRFNLCSHNG